ncbi:hypothetical protein PRIPAC_75602, partial [Pristionchus pacificus]|uniref:Uncharacterized protein n=1 Tax=Pristionchus pacificus TaxID=54126 RepID=A0A2A6C9E9_PRIPA
MFSHGYLIWFAVVDVQQQVAFDRQKIEELPYRLSRLFVAPNMSHPRVPLPKPMEILRIVEETVDVIVGAGEEEWRDELEEKSITNFSKESIKRRKEYSMEYYWCSRDKIRKDSNDNSRARYLVAKDIINLETKRGGKKWKSDNDDMTSVRMFESKMGGVRVVIEERPKKILLVTDKQIEWAKRYGDRVLCLDDTFNVTIYAQNRAFLVSFVLFSISWNGSTPKVTMSSSAIFERITSVILVFESGLLATGIPTCSSIERFSHLGIDRRSSPIGVNCGLERLNSRLKHQHLKSSGNSRLDHTMFQCVEMVNDMFERNFVADARNLVGGRYRLQASHTRHQEAIDQFSSVMVEAQSEVKFHVTSSNKKRKYVVTRHRDCPCQSMLNNHCTRCLACPYSWVCQCQDTRKAGVLCKHVADETGDERARSAVDRDDEERRQRSKLES